jgi:hypothetical protein|nr:MAG TPA: putative ATPase (AAA+ superfamily) [Caudoviricetes sp.]DAT36780.1 MAG TPA: putative ATPase [Caudoviricetes sp.]
MQIKRDFYLNQLIDRKHNGMIKIVSGIRRCGKSYLLSELFTGHLLDNGCAKDHIIHIDLDTRDDVKYRNPDTCNEYVKSCIKDDKMYYLLLDEVQMMEDFVSVLNGFLHIRNLDVYVTGSNSKFLSSDVVTEFRGRGDEIRVYPLSFSEIYPLYHDNWKKAWEDYTLYGGIPLVLTYQKEEQKVKYLKNLFKETYIKDIIDRNGIKNTAEFEELLEILSSSIGSLINPKKLENTFKSLKHVDLTAPTIKQYLDYLQDAFFINKVLRYDIKGKKYINTPFKCYFTDIGLRNTCIDFRQAEESHIMENIIYNELKIRGYNVDVGEVNVTAKTSAEVDFVANIGNKRYYIQSALDLPTPQKMMQEEKSLLNIRDGFKKIIITNNDLLRPYLDENGITIMSLKEFLLNKDSLEV